MYPGPRRIAYADALRKVWGDETTGHLADWFFIADDTVNVNILALPPGGSVTHSRERHTVFGADELLFVLEDTMMLANPEPGEVHRVSTNEAAFFRRDTWHHVFNVDEKPLRVLEFFHPTPATGSAEEYASTRPYLEKSQYADDRWLGR